MKNLSATQDTTLVTNQESSMNLQFGDNMSINFYNPPKEAFKWAILGGLAYALISNRKQEYYCICDC